ncbi:sensor histidine kinase [Roseateles amylovorans]|uniref:Histidine kinase n=1 Tax=Roseateles amylovorans TaxID=2978473 RepID=A0ABY6B3W8_9BURK|nr:histidine kinase [Roseateles amylovorans]UXH79884.1 histidine kinase [Roseateles amylovorans]
MTPLPRPTPVPPSATPTHGGLRLPTMADAGRWALVQFGLIVLIATIITLFLVTVFGQRWKPTFIYCFFISLACSFCCQSLRHVVGWIRWRVRRYFGWPVDGPYDWPGWPLMLGCLLLGSLVGYSLGVEMANFVTGFQERGLLNSNWRRALGGMLFSLFPGVALTLFFLGRSRLAAAEAKAELARRQAAETQLRLLESQLEPHMLFNTLANLRVLIGMDAERAQAMLDHLIAFLRATLSASRSERHALGDEFARLGDYLALMQVRMGSRLRFEFDLPEALSDIPVPPLLLQPLAENAIKHGLEPHVGGGLLRIGARVEAAELILEVDDDGRGLDPQASPSPGGGFGTQQVRERLAVAFGAAATLELSARPEGGTRARIRIPRQALAA